LLEDRAPHETEEARLAGRQALAKDLSRVHLPRPACEEAGKVEEEPCARDQVQTGEVGGESRSLTSRAVVSGPMVADATLSMG
jgi:hypothetical protein